MTKKDYIRIAAALAEARRQIPDTNTPINTGEFIANSTAARLIASALAEDNDKFDRARFLAACGVT